MRPLSWVGFIALFLRGIICGRISADFNPSQENLIELVPLMGKEFYVSLEISVPSNPSSFSKFLEIEEDLISLSVKPTGVFVFKYFSNNAFTTFEAPFTLQTNTFYRIEFLQTKIVDKVEVFIFVIFYKFSFQYIFEIRSKGRVFVSEVNAQPVVHSNVEVKACGDGTPMASGIIKNLHYNLNNASPLSSAYLGKDLQNCHNPSPSPKSKELE